MCPCGTSASRGTGGGGVAPVTPCTLWPQGEEPGVTRVAETESWGGQESCLSEEDGRGSEGGQKRRLTCLHNQTHEGGSVSIRRAELWGLTKTAVPSFPRVNRGHANHTGLGSRSTVIDTEVN